MWIGGGLPKTVALARTLSVAVNLWEGDALRVAELTTTGLEVTWGGPVGETVEEATVRLRAVAEAGATWAVCAWPDSVEVVAEAAEAVRALG